MKKLTIALLCIFISSHLFAQSKTLEVLTCEPEWAALITALGGEFIKVSSATTFKQDPHHIQARPSLIAKARKANLLVCSGAGLEEGWLPVLLRTSNNKNIQEGSLGYFMATQKVDLLEKTQQVDRADGDVHGLGNPHIHLNPYYVLKVANALSQTLAELAPEHKSNFENNLKSFDNKLNASLVEWAPRITTLKNKKAIVHHDSWIYLFEWLGIKNEGSLEPKPGLPPSTSHLLKLLAKVEQAPIDFIIYSSYQDNKAAQWLSKRSAAPAIQLPYSIDNWENEDAFIVWYDGLLSLLLEKNVAKVLEGGAE